MSQSIESIATEIAKIILGPGNDGSAELIGKAIAMRMAAKTLATAPTKPRRKRRWFKEPPEVALAEKAKRAKRQTTPTPTPTN